MCIAGGLCACKEEVRQGVREPLGGVATAAEALLLSASLNRRVRLSGQPLLPAPPPSSPSFFLPLCPLPPLLLLQAMVYLCISMDELRLGRFSEDQLAQLSSLRVCDRLMTVLGAFA